MQFVIVNPVECQLCCSPTCKLHSICTCNEGVRGICKMCISKMNTEKCPYCNREMKIDDNLSIIGFPKGKIIETLINRRNSFKTNCQIHSTNELLSSLSSELQIDGIRVIPGRIYIIRF